MGYTFSFKFHEENVRRWKDYTLVMVTVNSEV
ncbi:hypothetical protein MPER_03931 [Moniliophthora perniciosa FA553]|nr:hypothetical protein MPER_03931 [Moniliophthora perniciosa FA553]